MKMKHMILGMLFLVLFVMVPAGTVGAETLSDKEWRKTETGSAGVLEGKSVLVSIFVNDRSGKWNSQEKADVGKKLREATRYLKKEAKRYGKNVSFVSDIATHADLCYDATVDMKIKSSNQSQNTLYNKMERYIDKNIDVTALRTKYGTDSIGFLLHIEHGGVSSTQVHYMEDGSDYFYETASLFTRCDGKAEGASTYAHEILHLFGARDLYEAFPMDGISSSFVKYIKKAFPNDIMYTVYAKGYRQYKYKITNRITRVTAYFLGWRSMIPEVDKFGLPLFDSKGCFFEATKYES